MKSTKVMFVSITTFVMTYLLIGLIGYLLSDYQYRECLLNVPAIMFMLIFGWIPAAVVGNDYDKLLNQN